MTSQLYLHGIDVTNHDNNEIRCFVRQILQPLHDEGTPLIFSIRRSENYYKGNNQTTWLTFATTHENAAFIDMAFKKKTSPFHNERGERLATKQMESGEISTFKIDLPKKSEDNESRHLNHATSSCDQKGIPAQLNKEKDTLLLQTLLEKAKDLQIDLYRNSDYCGYGLKSDALTISNLDGTPIGPKESLVSSAPQKKHAL